MYVGKLGDERAIKLNHRVALASVIGLACLVRAAPPAEKSDLDPSRSELRAAIERYSADRGNLARAYPIEGSPNRQARMKQFYAEWLERLEEMNFDSLSPEGRIDYLLPRNHVQHELRQLAVQSKFREEEAPLTPFAAAILGLEEARRRMAPIDSPKAAVALNDLAK